MTEYKNKEIEWKPCQFVFTQLWLARALEDASLSASFTEISLKIYKCLQGQFDYKAGGHAAFGHVNQVS